MTDRELDAWLAEHLFGLGPLVWFDDVGPDPDDGRDIRGWGGEHAACYADDEPYNDPDKTWQWTVVGPNSSTGDGMLLVLQAMRERGFHWELQTSKARFSMPGVRHDWSAHFSADNVRALPRAVAEAAKAALEASAQ